MVVSRAICTISKPIVLAKTSTMYLVIKAAHLRATSSIPNSDASYATESQYTIVRTVHYQVAPRTRWAHGDVFSRTEAKTFSSVEVCDCGLC